MGGLDIIEDILRHRNNYIRQAKSMTKVGGRSKKMTKVGETTIRIMHDSNGEQGNRGLENQT